MIFNFHLGYASINVELSSLQPNIKQGNIESVTLSMGVEAAQKIDWPKLKGQTLGETIYLYDAEPIIHKQDSGKFESKIKIIFTTVPKEGVVVFKAQNQEVSMILKNLNVIPATSDKFIYNQFELPFKLNVFLATVSILASFVILGLVWIGVRRYKTSQSQKQIKHKVRLELTSASTYDEVIKIWYRRDLYLKRFPEISESFRSFEQKIFPFIFRPNISEIEKTKVLENYREFVSIISEVLDGI